MGFRKSFSFCKRYLVLVASTIHQKPPTEQLRIENWIQLLLSSFSTVQLHRALSQSIYSLGFQIIEITICLSNKVSHLGCTEPLAWQLLYFPLSVMRDRKLEGRCFHSQGGIQGCSALQAAFSFHSWPFLLSLLLQVHFSLTRKANGTNFNLSRNNPSAVHEAPALTKLEIFFPVAVKKHLWSLFQSSDPKSHCFSSCSQLHDMEGSMGHGLLLWH